MLPIVKWCVHRNILGVYTRVHVKKNASVFQLGVPIDHRSRYVLTHLGTHVNRVKNPSCVMSSRDIVAAVDLKPGDEITIVDTPWYTREKH